MMIAKGFNNYFANIGPTLASKINNDNVSHHDFISSDMNASLFLEPTNVTEIKLIIHELKEGASDIADIIVSLWLASDERTGTNNSPQSFFFFFNFFMKYVHCYKMHRSHPRIHTRERKKYKRSPLLNFVWLGIIVRIS